MAGAARRTAATFDRCIDPRERRLRFAKGEAIGPRLASVRRFFYARYEAGFPQNAARARLAAWQARRSTLCIWRAHSSLDVDQGFQLAQAMGVA